MTYMNLFGSNSSTGFSGMTNLFSDYNSIRNGSYGKLLKSYYGLGNTSGTTTGSTTKSSTKTTLDKILEERRNPTVSKEVSQANASLSQGISNIKSSISALQKDSTYEDTAGGQTATDKTVSAVKSFVSDYNDVVTSAKKSTQTGMTSNVAAMMKSTTANKDALAEIGITLNKDGTVSLNEKKLKAADTSKVQALFSADNKMSYGSMIASRANGASAYASNAAKTADSTDTKAETSASSTSLESDATQLASADLYKKITVKDAEGNETKKYDVDAITAKAKSFVENYNKLLSTAKNSVNSGVVANLKSIQAKTQDREDELNQIGIKLNKDGSLSLDEDTFKNADMSTVQKTFKNYGSSIVTNASLVNYYMKTQANTASGYSANGAYNVYSPDNYSSTI